LTGTNDTIRVLYKGATAQLRAIERSKIDRETARGMYDEIMSIAADLAKKHGLGQKRQMRVVVVK
jgi:hypothetical protein